VAASRTACYRWHICSKLCGKPRNMPPPLYVARCSPVPAHTRLAPAAPSAPCSMNIHDRQAAARSGLRRRNCCPYKVCSDLNSQPKWPGDLDLWRWKWCPSHMWRGLLCANFCLPRPLCSRVTPDVRNRQTDVTQTDVRRQTKSID